MDSFVNKIYMFGILLLLILFWVLVFIFEKKIYDALGLIPNQKKMVYFLTGFLFSGILVVLKIAIATIFFSLHWKIRDPNDLQLALVAGKLLVSVFTEELLFRGIIIYVLIKMIKKHTAMLISSALFGIYHWFSYEMFGAGLIPMLYVFVTTALAGYCWAFAYVNSRTILLPIGLHFGWNSIDWLFAKNGSYGEGLFIKVQTLPLTEIQNLALALFNGLVPVACMYLVLRMYFASQNKSQDQKTQKTVTEPVDTDLSEKK